MAAFGRSLVPGVHKHSLAEGSRDPENPGARLYPHVPGTSVYPGLGHTQVLGLFSDSGKARSPLRISGRRRTSSSGAVTTRDRRNRRSFQKNFPARDRRNRRSVQVTTRDRRYRRSVQVTTRDRRNRPRGLGALNEKHVGFDRLPVPTNAVGCTQRQPTYQVPFLRGKGPSGS